MIEGVYWENDQIFRRENPSRDAEYNSTEITSVGRETKTLTLRTSLPAQSYYFSFSEVL